MRYLLAHTKPNEGTVVVSGSPVRKEFYQESEWRHVPKHADIEEFLSRSDFEDKKKREQCNQRTRLHCVIKFLPQDVKYIFVPSDTDIPEIMNFIQTDLDHFPSADLKVLMSRVTSLESIARDL